MLAAPVVGGVPLVRDGAVVDVGRVEPLELPRKGENYNNSKDKSNRKRTRCD